MTNHSSSTSSSSIPLGIWAYVMSDAILFAALFAAYAVLHTATANGPTPEMIFERHTVFIETLILLTSSFTCGLAVIAARSKQVAGTWIALIATLLLGIAFLYMEVAEFHGLIAGGHSWRESAFLSSFFTLVGTHGLHVAVGALWLLLLLAYLAARGLSAKTERGILYFSLFWHFLDIIWICIFSFVYLFGIL